MRQLHGIRFPLLGTYWITAGNEGGGDAERLVLTDPLPSGTTYARFVADRRRLERGREDRPG
ncbi:DUF11 domain-containing protein [Streptomyces bikiniensis]|uniref:DUF11 domain-containing protein n=1 Tax=Streptomyces bikiniensis TaxID=1896 RepID=UPI00068B06B4|nr:DUF11 domain-containing protein [Streptomyces bikiniensis]